MFQNIQLPKNLLAEVSGENQEFVAKEEDQAGALGGLIFKIIIVSAFFIIPSSVALSISMGPLISDTKIRRSTFGESTIIGPENSHLLIWDIVLLGLWLLVGIAIIWWSVRSYMRRGIYFVGTPTRLVKYDHGKIESTDWEQFSGEMAVSGNNEKGSIVLELKTGKVIDRMRREEMFEPDVFMPDGIYMTGIKGVLDVERICRSRTEENITNVSGDNKFV